MNEGANQILEDLGPDLAAAASTNGKQPPGGPMLEIISAADLVRRVENMPPATWLIRGIWPADAYGVQAAEWKAGKTWAVLDLAVSAASGTPWMGAYPVDRPGPVLLFLGEGGERKMERRLQAICEARNVKLADLPIRMCFRVPHLGSQFHLDQIVAELEQTPAVLGIIDPLYLAARGAKASALYEMGQYLEPVQHIFQQAGAALAVVTHYNRSEGTGSKRMTGAGPAEWGRVLVNLAVVSRRTDPETKASTVVLQMGVEGDEVPDTSVRLRRTVSADDPDDITSPLHYEVEILEDSVAAAAEEDTRPPSVRRCLFVLEGAEDWLSVPQIGDRLASEGWPLRKRTIQAAMARLVKDGCATSHGPEGQAYSWRLTAALAKEQEGCA